MCQMILHLNSLFQIIELCNLKDDVSKRAHSIIDKFADRGLRSLAVAQQVRLIMVYLVKKNINIS